MIFLAVIAGLYLIGFTGYYKMTARIADSVEDTKLVRQMRPVMSALIVGSISAIWPVMILWSLAGEASK